MSAFDFFTDSHDEYDLSIDTDYSSSSSGGSSPCPVATSSSPLPQLDRVLYYVVVLSGYHLELTSIQEPHLALPAHQPGSVSDEATEWTSSPVSSAEPKHRLIKWSLPPPPVQPANLPGWAPMPYGLERFWQSAFAWFFRPYLAAHNHVWTLEPVELPPVSSDWPWHSVSHTAKVHFQCSVKHPGWTSKKGLVVFWFRMRRQGDQTICEVLFKPYGQQCCRCNQETLSQQSAYLPALWYPENVEEAIRALAIHMDQLYYGGGRSDLFRCGIDRQFIRVSSKSSGLRHDSSRCQACHEGMCVFNVPLTML